MTKKVLLGFSGGIDSRASVGFLREQGYHVTALTLDTTGDSQMLESARRRAEELGVEIIVDDVRQSFSHEVVDYFVDRYMNGLTPAPCTICNPRIKWRRLEQVADNLGIEYIATGHYFRIVEYGGHRYVARGVDDVKDQSYYLWGLPQHLLSRIVTPMGERHKSNMRAHLGLDASARESMGVCFLDGRSYGELIKERSGVEICAGEVVDREGTIVGRHSGFPYYTIGQKRGFELFSSYLGACVVGIHAAENRLIVGEDRDLYHHNLIVSDCNIVDLNELVVAEDISVMIRGLGRNPEGFARVSICEGQDCGSSVDSVCVRGSDMRLHVVLDSPAWAAAEGQPVVFYRGERVVGGGFLEKYF